GDQFGFAVQLNADRVFVGAPFVDLEAAADAGELDIFDRRTGNVQTWHKLAPEAGDRLGSSVGVLVDFPGVPGIPLVGAPFDDEVLRTRDGGAVYFLLGFLNPFPVPQ